MKNIDRFVDRMISHKVTDFEDHGLVQVARRYVAMRGFAGLKRFYVTTAVLTREDFARNTPEGLQRMKAFHWQIADDSLGDLLAYEFETIGGRWRAACRDVWNAIKAKLPMWLRLRLAPVYVPPDEEAE